MGFAQVWRLERACIGLLESGIEQLTEKTVLLSKFQALQKAKMTLLKLVYTANVFVAGWISITSLFMPKVAQQTVFSNAFEYSEAIRLAGALWGAIFILSILGLFYPKQMILVLLFQLIYKASWLVFAALPALMNNQPYPKGMAVFFVIWVLVLPFVIPWREIFVV